MFCVDRAAGHARAARACAGALVRKLDAAVSELGEASAASDAAAARALRALGGDSEAPFEHALRWACHHLARAPFAEAEAALVCSASYLRWRVDADQTRELVADAQRAAGGSRDAFLARDALVLARQVVATYGAAWLCDQLWHRLAPFAEGDEAPGGLHGDPVKYPMLAARRVPAGDRPAVALDQSLALPHALVKDA